MVKIAEKNQNGFFAQMKENLWRVPLEVISEATQQIAYGFLMLMGQIIDLQDELAEVALIITNIGDTTEDVARNTANFLYASIEAAVTTGQQFQEGIQSNIQNLKQLAFVRDDQERQRIAGELSVIQLGAQTAFGLTLEQSLSSIPSIYAQQQSAVDMSSPEVQAMSETDQSVYRAETALTGLQGIMNGLVVAQRESGAAGADLLQVFASMGTSAADAGMSENELMSLAAVASVKIAGGSEQVANAVKMLMERTYGEGADDLKRLGIETQELTTDEFGNTKLRSRNFLDILEEAYELKKAKPELSGQINQAMGSQRNAASAALLIGGVPEQQRVLGEMDQVTEHSNQFMEVVLRKSEQFGGQLNKVQSSFALLLNEILFGSGVMDDLGEVIGNVADMFLRLATLMKDNPAEVEWIKEAGKVLLTVFV